MSKTIREAWVIRHKSGKTYYSVRNTWDRNMKNAYPFRKRPITIDGNIAIPVTVTIKEWRAKK